MSEVVPIQSARHLCSECAKGHHVYCLSDVLPDDDQCECPCGDDFDPDDAGEAT